jgi:hypothetical protein
MRDDTIPLRNSSIVRFSYECDQRARSAQTIRSKGSSAIARNRLSSKAKISVNSRSTSAAARTLGANLLVTARRQLARTDKATGRLSLDRLTTGPERLEALPRAHAALIDEPYHRDPPVRGAR